MAVAQKVITLAVIRCDAELLDGLAMFLGGVALVGEPVVLRIFLSQLVHIVVTVGLGENRGGSDGEIFPIALDDGGMG